MASSAAIACRPGSRHQPGCRPGHLGPVRPDTGFDARASGAPIFGSLRGSDVAEQCPPEDRELDQQFPTQKQQRADFWGQPALPKEPAKRRQQVNIRWGDPLSSHHAMFIARTARAGDVLSGPGFAHQHLAGVLHALRVDRSLEN
jgi:hypothetical protein